MSWKKKELVETELPFLGFYDLNLCKGTRTPQETHGVRAHRAVSHMHISREVTQRKERHPASICLSQMLLVLFSDNTRQDVRECR